jgi:hypothetical protein
MKTKKEPYVQVGKNAVRIRTINKQVLVASNELVDDALLIEIAYCINAENHQIAHYSKIKKNTFVNSISLKESTAVQVYACLHKYFKLKGITIQIV